MKFRMIIKEEEITVITEDGGIACISKAEPISNGSIDDTTQNEPRTATSEYYSERIAQDGINQDNVFDILAEGEIYSSDWADKQFNDLSLVQEALDWLNPNEESWEVCEDIFNEAFPLN